MPAKKMVDYKKLLKAVESGKPQSEIVKEFKFSTIAQFKNHYLNALMEAGKAPEIQTKRGPSKTVPANEVSVSKRGSIVISKALVDKMGFAEGTMFSVRKTKSGISLKRMS